MSIETQATVKIDEQAHDTKSRGKKPTILFLDRASLSADVFIVYLQAIGFVRPSP